MLKKIISETQHKFTAVVIAAVHIRFAIILATGTRVCIHFLVRLVNDIFCKAFHHQLFGDTLAENEI